MRGLDPAQKNYTRSLALPTKRALLLYDYSVFLLCSIFHFGDYFDRSVEVPKLKKQFLKRRHTYGTSALVSRVFCLMQLPTPEISAQIGIQTMYQNQTSPLNFVRWFIDLQPLQQPLRSEHLSIVRCSLACRVPSHGNAAVTFSTWRRDTWRHITNTAREFHFVEYISISNNSSEEIEKETPFQQFRAWDLCICFNSSKHSLQCSSISVVFCY